MAVTPSSALPLAPAVASTDEVLVRVEGTLAGGTIGKDGKTLARLQIEDLPGGGGTGALTPANQVIAGPASGASAPAGPRALVVADLPSLGVSNLSDGDQVLTTSGVQDVDGPKTFASGVLIIKNGDNGRLTVLSSQDANVSVLFPGADGTLATQEAIAAAFQPLDSDLTAIASLATTAFGRALLTLADAAAGRSTLGLGTAATASASSFAAASHTHAAADIVSGVIAAARLGTGTPDTTTFLRGDGSWQTVTISQSIAPTWTGAHTWQSSAQFTRGAITTSDPLLVTQTWNASGVTFDAIDVNVTNTASQSTSRLINLRVGGTSQFSVTRAGAVTATGNVQGANLVTVGSILSNSGLFFYINSSAANTIQLGSTSNFSFSSTTNPIATNDTNMSRVGAGQTGFGTGAQGSVAGEVVTTKFRAGSTTGPFWSAGTGSPEGVVTAPVGSLYSRTDGGASTTLYAKESGTGNTGWIGK